MRRLRLGEWVALAGGAALLVSLLFLPWYHAFANAVPLGAGETSLTGFEAFSVLDVVLAAIALIPFALAFMQATRDDPTWPVALSIACIVVGALAVVLVAYRMLNQPGPNELIEVGWGAWVGLLGAVLIVAGGWRALATEHVPGLPPAPEPELRPPPA